MRLGRNLVPGKIPRIHKDGLLKLLAIVERIPELVFSYNEIDDYLNCHHRIFVQQPIEANADIHSQALGQSPRVQLKTGIMDYMSNRG